MKVSLIVAVAENGVIEDNDLIWDLPKDMRFQSYYETPCDCGTQKL